MRRLLQYRLSVLFVAFIPLAFSSLWIRDYLDNRPVSWSDYDDVELQQHLNDGRTVLLFVTQNT